MVNWGFQGSRLDPPPELPPGHGGLLLPQQDVVVFIPEKVMVQAWQPKEKRCLRDFVLLKGAEGVPSL